MLVLKCLQRPQREWETDEKSKETLIAAFRVCFFFKSMMRAVIDVSTLISNLMIAALALSWKSGFSPKQSLENSLPCEVTNVHHFRDRKKKNASHPQFWHPLSYFQLKQEESKQCPTSENNITYSELVTESESWKRYFN